MNYSIEFNQYESYRVHEGQIVPVIIMVGCETVRNASGQVVAESYFMATISIYGVRIQGVAIIAGMRIPMEVTITLEQALAVFAGLPIPRPVAPPPMIGMRVRNVVALLG